MATLYAQYDAVDNATVSGHSIWNTQAGGGGSWATPASGDTLNMNGHAVTGCGLTGYPCGNDVGAVWTLAGTGSYTTPNNISYINAGLIIVYCSVVFQTTNQGEVLCKSGGDVTFMNVDPNGLIVCEGGGQVVCDGVFPSGAIICESGGSVSVTGFSSNLGLLLCESGGDLALGDSFYNSVTIIVESGGTLAAQTDANYGFIGYYTSATVTGITAVAFGTERRTLHYQGDQSTHLHVLPALTTTLYAYAAAPIFGPKSGGK